MKHESPRLLGESSSFGGMTTQDTTIEIRDNAYGTIPGFWPDEAVLTDFAEKDDRSEQDALMEQTDQPIKDDSAYAALYFVS